jgi:hypothetical protein
MTPECQKPSELKSLLATTAIIGGIYLLSNLAFSLATRKKIGQRDHWQCQDCGAKFSDGTMVHASHFFHDRSDPNYDKPESGRIQCVDCHENYHLLYQGNASEIGMTEAGNDAAIELLTNTDRATRKK